MIKDFKLFETISKEEKRNNMAKHMRDIKLKNIEAGTVHNEVDPLGEEVWDIQDKEETVLNNIYKVSTDKINKHGQKVYNMFVKTEKGYYVFIGEILYWKNGEKMEEEDWDEKDRETLDFFSSRKFPPGMNKEDEVNNLKNYLLNKKQERLRGNKPSDFVVYLIDDKSKYRNANIQEVNKMQRVSEAEINSLKKQLSYELMSGNIDVDLDVEVTHFDNLYHLIKEAVKISDYKPYHNKIDSIQQEKWKEYFKKFPDHDKNYNRIYFDLKITPKDWKVQIPQEIKDYMEWFRYPILDYDKGICQDKDGREIRIGKLFYRLGRQDLLKSYEESKQNTLKEGNYKIVISRHPYDIIGQSTGRGWSSCMDLRDDRFDKKFIESWYGLSKQIKQSHLVSYLVRENDRNIKTPMARIMIVRRSWPYGSHGTTITKEPFKIDDHVYGTKVKGHLDFLTKWIEDYNNEELEKQIKSNKEKSSGKSGWSKLNNNIFGF
jgi:hypothetical protein